MRLRDDEVLALIRRQLAACIETCDANLSWDDRAIRLNQETNRICDLLFEYADVTGVRLDISDGMDF